MLRFHAFALSFLLLLPSVPSQEANRGITPEQVAELRQVLSVHVSPDGSHVAFVRLVPRGGKEPAGPARAHLWILDEGVERQLVGGGSSVRGVSFSPDGKLITFVQSGPGSRHPEVWGLTPQGGEPVRVTTTPHGVSTYAWRPDGSGIAYVTTDPAETRDAKARARGFRQKVVDEDFRHRSLWAWDRKTGQTRRYTSGVTVNSFKWSPDGRHILAGIAPRNLVDDQYMATRLHVIDADTGESRRLVNNPGKLGDYAVSRDGSQAAYISASQTRDPHAGMLYVVDMKEGAAPRGITEGYAGMVHHVEWMDDGSILATCSEGVASLIYSINPATGERTGVFSQEGIAFKSCVQTRAQDGSRTLHATASTPTHPAEVFRFQGSTAVRLTDSNPWLSDVALGKQEITRFKARDGLEIEGLLMYPLDYEEGRQYPLVIVAHGGPESHFSNGWNTSYSAWGQLLSARGWFAWYPNYRSSTGYGVRFAMKDHGDPMGAEFRDHLDAINLFVSKKMVDRSRVGIGGGSYGGYTAAWAATRQSRHFAAAVSFVPFVDIRTKWYTSDIPMEFFYVHYQQKWPHEQANFLAQRSPLFWAPKCRTPLLLLGGTSDPRVHPSQPFMLYRAVKTSTRTPVRYIQYPGEGHGNRVDVNRYDYCVRTLRWFDHYLKPGDHRNDPPPNHRIDYSRWRAW